MNLFLRVISAVVLLPVVLVLIHLGGRFMFGLVLVASAICLFEYGGIVSQKDRTARWTLVVVGTLITAAGMLLEDATLALLSVQLGGLALAILFTVRTGEFSSAWPRMAALAFGLPYVALAMISIYRLRALGEPLGNWAAPTWLYVVLIATWSNDTFAYFAGRAFGKHKLYEKVSPKKTWEGFAGGALGTVGMLLLAKAALPTAFGHFHWADLVWIGAPTAVLGPLGDLAESLLKRNYGVKDSGRTIPGHGGMLDRVDAVFFVAPWVLLYAVGLRSFVIG